MNVLLICPTEKARQNFESRVRGTKVKVFECRKHDEVRDLLASTVIDMVLIFLHKIDAELIWIFGLIMDYGNIRVIGLMENEEVDINFEQKIRKIRNKNTEYIFT